MPPSVAWREWQQAPPALLLAVLEAIDYAALKARYDAGATADELPDHPLRDWLVRIDFEVSHGQDRRGRE